MFAIWKLINFTVLRYILPTAVETRTFTDYNRCITFIILDIAFISFSFYATKKSVSIHWLVHSRIILTNDYVINKIIILNKNGTAYGHWPVDSKLKDILWCHILQPCLNKYVCNGKSFLSKFKDLVHLQLTTTQGNNTTDWCSISQGTSFVCSSCTWRTEIHNGVSLL